MQTLPVKKKVKTKSPKQDGGEKEEEDLVTDTSFIQVDQEKKGKRRCYCCGDPKCLLLTCPKKDNTKMVREMSGWERLARKIPFTTTE